MDPRLCEKRGFKVGETTTALLPSGKLLLSVDTVFVDDDVAVFCLGVFVLGFLAGGAFGILSDEYFFISFSYLSCPFHTFHSRPKLNKIYIYT